MNTLDILKAARVLLNSPARWTQGATARDNASRICSPLAYRARYWSLAGAIFHAAPTMDAYRAAIEQLEQALPSPYTSIEELNDLSTHATILAFLDSEIARLESGARP